jgi:hypothetical protein
LHCAVVSGTKTLYNAYDWSIISLIVQTVFLMNHFAKAHPAVAVLICRVESTETRIRLSFLFAAKFQLEYRLSYTVYTHNKALTF